MDKETLRDVAADFCNESPTNYLPKRDGLSAAAAAADNFARNNIYGALSDAERLGADAESGYVGMRFYGDPVLSIGAADDPGFLKLKEPDIIGPFHKMPEEWLPGAKTVISFFLPFEKRIVEANRKDPVEPAMEWLMARVDGQKHLLAFGRHICETLEHEGYRAVAPQLEDAYIMRPARFPVPGGEDVIPFASNWSERHVGFVTGLGTFGLSTNFISKAGSAGRLIGVITDWEAEPDKKDYGDWLAYCNKCGACVRRCPARAYAGCEPGRKNHEICGEHIHFTCLKYEPRYGCGKCIAGMPCAYTALPAS
ncbi:MAG: epoxyqueuosine reductase [Clostridiales Family XIII bacterium]|jgi:epoxyqueuosine reductase QueG|nr:epoxyqueuosine reductase [Clostridiales Family XIII bacterium]